MSNSPRIQDVHFDKSGGKINVDILIGQRPLGIYTLTLYDSFGKNPEVIGKGNNADSLPDQYVIKKSPNLLDNRMCGWVITISDPSNSLGESYFARITFTQDGKNLEDGPFEYSGPLQGQRFLIGFARFRAT